MKIHKLQMGNNPNYVPMSGTPCMRCPECENLHLGIFSSEVTYKCGKCNTYFQDGKQVDVNHVISEAGVFYEVKEHDVS